MAQRTKRRSHRSSGAAAGTTGPLPAPYLHSVDTTSRADSHSRADTHPPNRHDTASIWSRRRVLLLNSTYEPLTALPMRRAIVRVICGKADVVHADPTGPVIHSASKSIAVPSVIQLRTYVRVPYRALVPMTRAALMHRDRFICAYCGAKADTVDHVVPRSRGGDPAWEPHHQGHPWSRWESGL